VAAFFTTLALISFALVIKFARKSASSNRHARPFTVRSSAKAWVVALSACAATSIAVYDFFLSPLEAGCFWLWSVWSTRFLFYFMAYTAFLSLWVRAHHDSSLADVVNNVVRIVTAVAIGYLILIAVFSGLLAASQPVIGQLGIYALNSFYALVICAYGLFLLRVIRRAAERRRNLYVASNDVLLVESRLTDMNPSIRQEIRMRNFVILANCMVIAYVTLNALYVAFDGPTKLHLYYPVHYAFQSMLFFIHAYFLWVLRPSTLCPCTDLPPRMGSVKL
jgi:hypothetical protein